MKNFLLILSKKNKCFSNIYSRFHTIIMLSIVVGIIITLVIGIYSNRVQSDISNNLLRLHIIANSDLSEDQALKLDIRDAIIKEMTSKFKTSKSISETNKIAYDNLTNIKKISENIIKEKGKPYQVKVSIGESFFPTKYYGDIALPTGSYNALKVEIGEAKGQNWWCVLFPPLCFVDAANGKLPETSKENLKSVLTDEEYKLISTANIDDNVPVKIKFKSVELWQKSKHTVQVAIQNFNK